MTSCRRRSSIHRKVTATVQFPSPFWMMQAGTRGRAEPQLLRPGLRFRRDTCARTLDRSRADRTYQLVAKIFDVSAQMHYLHRLRRIETARRPVLISIVLDCVDAPSHPVVTPDIFGANVPSTACYLGGFRESRTFEPALVLSASRISFCDHTTGEIHAGRLELLAPVSSGLKLPSVPSVEVGGFGGRKLW